MIFEKFEEIKHLLSPGSFCTHNQATHPLKLWTADRMTKARMAFSMTRPAIAAHVLNMVLDTALGLCGCEGVLGGEGERPRAMRSCFPGVPRSGALASPTWSRIWLALKSVASKVCVWRSNVNCRAVLCYTAKRQGAGAFNH